MSSSTMPPASSVILSPAAMRALVFIFRALLVIPTVGAVAAFVLAWQQGVSATALWAAAIMYSLTMLAAEAGYHRLFTHQAYKASPWVRGAMAILGAMMVEGPVTTWTAIHRKHHAFADREGDPHSPHLHGSGLWGQLRGLWHAHISWAWFFVPDMNELIRYTPDLQKDRLIVALDRFYLLWVALGMAIPGAVCGLIEQSWRGALEGVLWGGMVRIFFVNQVIFAINSLTHTFGSRPCKARDKSTNLFWLAIISFGIGWHNNHHAYPAAAHLNFKWWQIDISGYFISLLEKLGLAWDLRSGKAAEYLPGPETAAAPVQEDRAA